VVSNLRILHIGDVAGVPQTLAKEQRECGDISHILSFENHPYAYGVDFHHTRNGKWPFDYLVKLGTFSKYAAKYDVLHFHYGSLLPKGADTLLWRSLSKKVIIHHHGSELRDVGEKLIYLRTADRIFVSTPDLLEWSSTAEWIPNPISLQDFPFTCVTNLDESKPLLIVHSPSNRAVKGTSIIEHSIDDLKKEGYNVKLLIVEGVKHSHAIELYKQADIAIDQLLIGWYGMFAVECMALGKPVCCFIRDDLIDRIPKETIQDVTTNNLTDSLRELIVDRNLRQKLGVNGRHYVEKRHDSKIIARQVMKSYY